VDWILELMLDFEEKPYHDEKLTETSWIRTFDPSIVDSDEYVWHRDKKDRKVTVLEGEGWKFQFDNEIPQSINITEIIEIPRESYHRLIPGKTRLKLHIEEFDNQQ
jgi:hypothetical protein